MGYTFRIIFEGICAYLPDTPFFVPGPEPAPNPIKSAHGAIGWPFLQAGNSSALQVLLPDLRSPTANSVLPIAPHFATLRVNLSDLASGTDRDHQIVVRQPGNREEFALYCLDTDDISLKVESSADDPFTFGGWVPKPYQKRPDLSYRSQVESVFWLPRISEIAEGIGSLLPEFSFGSSLASGLAARITTTTGYFRVHGFNLEADRLTPRIWRFADPTIKNPPGVWNRAVGNRMALEFPHVEEPVRIRLENSKYSSETFVVCAPPASSGREVEVFISNVEPESLFAEQRQVGDFDPDFGALYSLFSPGTAQFSVPNPGGVEFLGAIEKPCVGGTT